jgi:hypothetical protein
MGAQCHPAANSRSAGHAQGQHHAGRRLQGFGIGASRRGYEWVPGRSYAGCRGKRFLRKRGRTSATDQFITAIAPRASSEGRFFECLVIVQHTFAKEAGGCLAGSRRIPASKRAEDGGLRIERNLHERVHALSHKHRNPGDGRRDWLSMLDRRQEMY